jgi:soluble lytic murein transglycosylase-like protein
MSRSCLSLGTATAMSHGMQVLTSALLIAASAMDDGLAAGPCDALRGSLSAAQAAKFKLSSSDCGEAAAVIDSQPASSQQLRLFDQAFDRAPRVAEAVIEVPPSARSTIAVPPLADVPSPASSTRLPRAVRLAPDVDAAARRHDIDPLLLHAIAHVESRHNAAAVSRAGALGMMQVMPATARRFGIDDAPALRDVNVNLDVAATYLKALQQRFGNDLALVLAAYNAGEGAVERHGRRVPPFAETRGYVREVLARYAALQRVAHQLAAAPQPLS